MRRWIARQAGLLYLTLFLLVVCLPYCVDLREIMMGIRKRINKNL